MASLTLTLMLAPRLVLELDSIWSSLPASERNLTKAPFQAPSTEQMQCLCLKYISYASNSSGKRTVLFSSIPAAT